MPDIVKYSIALKNKAYTTFSNKDEIFNLVHSKGQFENLQSPWHSHLLFTSLYS